MTMQYDDAITQLHRKLQNGSAQDAADLVAWLNLAEPDTGDVERLAALYNGGKFNSWECGAEGCDTRVYQASPDDWDHFQGADQVDYTSYPGEGHNQDHCDHHRCWPGLAGKSDES